MERKYGTYLRIEPNVVLPSRICSRPFKIPSKKKEELFVHHRIIVGIFLSQKRKEEKKVLPSEQKPPRSLNIRVYIFNQVNGIATLELNQPVPGERSLANSVIFDDSV